MYNKKLIIVDESYTSCTCGKCNNINNIFRFNKLNA